MQRSRAAVPALIAVLLACGRDPSAQRVRSSPEATPSPTPSATPAPTQEPTAVPGTGAPATQAATAAPTAAPAPNVRAERVAAMDQPVALDVLGETILIAEKGGRVRTLQGATVLDIASEVRNSGEQGLLGIAVSPDRTKLYVHFSDCAGDGDTRLREYTLGPGPSATGPRDMLTVDQPYANHNGGQLAFGPDGRLYMGLGDGGSGGDPHDNGQRLDTVLGKLLRIDPRPDGGRGYTIPGDNPFVGRSGARGEIWAYGLRNPWRFSFDRGNGDLWIGDVGQNAWEEIDHRPASSRGGENYGWNRLEGRHRFEGSAPPEHVLPVHEYANGSGNCSVTGGYVYRGGAIAGLEGTYVYADFCAGRIRGFTLGGSDRSLGARVANLASFGQDASGELYALSLDGGVYALRPA